MYKKLDWNENFELGIQEIDDQHKMFVIYINALLADLEAGIEHTPEQIKSVIANASAFLEKHCKAEENLMLDMKFPYESYKSHYNAHTSFRIKMHNYEVMTIDENNWRQNFLDFAKLVLGWIQSHEMSADLKLAKFIKDDIKYTDKVKLKIKEFFKNNII